MTLIRAPSSRRVPTTVEHRKEISSETSTGAGAAQAARVSARACFAGACLAAREDEEAKGLAWGTFAATGFADAADVSAKSIGLIVGLTITGGGLLLPLLLLLFFAKGLLQLPPDEVLGMLILVPGFVLRANMGFLLDLSSVAAPTLICLL